MTEIITAAYESAATLTNVVDDLVSTGIPREKIRVLDDKREIQVSAPGAIQPEIREILSRHGPIELHT